MKRNLNTAYVFISALSLAFLIAGCGGRSSASVWQPEASIPVAGPVTADSPRVDAQMIELMKTYNVPGMSLAITKNGRLILARGYGYADREALQQMQPDSRGRIGSISKTATAVALLHLEEEGKLNLDTPFLNILTQYQLPANGDPRMLTVSVRQIMHHTGGWDTSASGDVEQMSPEIAKALGVPEPTNCGDWIRYKLGKPLDFTPGTKFSYSNFGYCLLGRVIEKITGKNYYDYVRANVLKPMGIQDFATAYTLESQRQAREVKYYDFPGASWVHSVFPPYDLTPAPYGWAQMEALEGMGGWIASPIDLTRFMNSVDGTRGTQFLTPASVQQFLEDPQVLGFQSQGWYGLGIVAAPVSGGLYWWHNGGCPGTAANVVHRPDGYDWAVVMNTRSKNDSDLFNDLIQRTDTLINAGMSDSGTDLYEQYPSNP